MSRDLLKSLFEQAIDVVGGRAAVSSACRQLDDFTPGQIIAVGKAAGDMTIGALDVFGVIPALVITKYHHTPDRLVGLNHVTVIEAAHPIPDAQSLLAGKKLLDTIQTTQGPLLVLISGGASALAEHLVDGMDFADWQKHNRQLIASGKTISQINHWRKQQSQIKDGRLLAHYKGPQIVVMAISDVQGDDLSVIGSGLGDIRRISDGARAEIVACNGDARSAIVAMAQSRGIRVIHNDESLYGDVFDLSKIIADKLINGKPGLYVFGGEPTIILPSKPGNGGRNQSLALALAGQIEGLDHISILVAGTDGTDGPTDAAGAIIDGDTFGQLPGAAQALTEANAGQYLRNNGDILVTGPTGTNVMDIVVALVGEAIA